MTTLSTDFLRSIVMVAGFRGQPMHAAQAAFLMMGLRGDFCGADLPAEIANGDKHLAGCAIGALLALELVEVVGRCKSPHKDAKSRKVNVYRIPAHRISTARVWLARHGFSATPAEQMSLAV